MVVNLKYYPSIIGRLSTFIEPRQTFNACLIAVSMGPESEDTTAEQVIHVPGVSAPYRCVSHKSMNPVRIFRPKFMGKMEEYIHAKQVEVLVHKH